MTIDHDAHEDRFDALGLEAPFNEDFDSENRDGGAVLAELGETPFAEALDESWSEAEAGEAFGPEDFGPPYTVEEQDFGLEMPTPEGLLESEVGGLAALVAGPNLRRGSTGAAVETLQRALVTLGIAMAVDGKFGPATERGVRTFQSRKRLTADGIAGPRTKTAIAAALGGQTPIPPTPVPTPPAPTSTLADAIVRVANEENHRWHPQSGELKETYAAATPILQEYYRLGTGPNSVPSAANLQSATWHRTNFWSAVFISYVMRRAGAGTAFAYSGAHRTYVRAARLNRLNSVTGNPFWAYRSTEVAPQVGDLVCNGRAGDNVTYDNVADNRNWQMHCDVVTEVRAGSLRVIGGNVRDDVSAKTIHTLADGRVDPQRHPHHFAILRCRGPIGGQQPAPIPPVPMPPVPRPVPGPTALGRLVVERHALLASHRGTAPDLILRWSQINQSGPVDVVVHFHGYSGQKTAMRIDLHKERASGLDFTDPAGSAEPGRSRPTIGVLPRGNYFGGSSGEGYNFPNLTPRGAVRQLVDDAVARVGAQTGRSLSLGRLILTGHSGGGAPVSAILAHTDPDEVYIFDGMYGSSANVVSWAKKRIERELSSPGALPPALRILYRQGSQKFPGTQPNSEVAGRELGGALRAPAAARLRPFFQVVQTSVGHGDIPAAFGWRLLANPAAVLPKTTVFSGAVSGETEDLEASEFWESPATDREESEQEAINMEQTGEDHESYGAAGEGWMGGESLAWLDVEAPAIEAQWEQPLGEDERSEPQYETEWPPAESEWESGEGYESEEFDYFEQPESADAGEEEGYATDVASLEMLLEAEAGVGSVLAERMKGVAALVVGPTLRRGSTGAGVSTLQRALVSLGASIAVDGNFGPNTEIAVRSFQQRSGLTADGIVGPRTKAAIAAALGGPGPAPVPPPVPSSAGLGDTIARLAEQEYRRWHPSSGNLRETDTAAVPILQQYYQQGVNTSVSATQLQDTTWQQNHPWSAVFVSWVMRMAGAGTGFAYSRAHQGYVCAARTNRLNANSASPFWAYRATEVAPQVGDIIVAQRQNSGATYDNIGDPQHRATHGDIVTEVRVGSLRVIGGNVNQNVDAKVIRTLPDGRLALDSNQSRFFAVVRCRGVARRQQPHPVPAPTPPPAPAPSGTKMTPA